jgi:hypothetical protein
MSAGIRVRSHEQLKPALATFQNIFQVSTLKLGVEGHTTGSQWLAGLVLIHESTLVLAHKLFREMLLERLVHKGYRGGNTGRGQFERMRVGLGNALKVSEHGDVVKFHQFRLGFGSKALFFVHHIYYHEKSIK